MSHQKENLLQAHINAATVDNEIVESKAEVVVNKKTGAVTVVHRNRSNSRSRPPMAPPSDHGADDAVSISAKATKPRKHKPVKSSGYGKGKGGNGKHVRNPQRNLTANSSYASDDDSASSTGSLCSNSTGGRRRIQPPNRQRSSSRQRHVHSAPSSPVGSVGSELPKYTRSSSRPRAGSQDYTITPGSSWAQQQREQQRQRQERSRSKPELSQQHGANFESSHSPKRTAALMNDSTTAEGRVAKSRKISALSSPCSSADSSRYHYDGTNITNDDNDDQSLEEVKPSFRRTANGLIASLTSPGLKTSSKRNGTNCPSGREITTPSSSSSNPRAAQTPSRRRLASKATLEHGRTTPTEIDPLSSEVRMIAEAMFAKGTGISHDEVQKILKSRVAGAKQWELKKKVEASAAVIRKLKDTLNNLHQTKNRFCTSAIDAEIASRKGMIRATHKADELEEERSKLKSKLGRLESECLSLKDNVKDAHREIRQNEEKISSLEAQLAPLKEALSAAERKHTEVALALAVAEGRSEEAAKQADSWRAEIASIEAAKAEAVKLAEAAISTSMEKEMTALRDECSALRTKMEAREEELGRLVNSNSKCGGMAGIKKELDRLKDTESMLALRTAELERAQADRDAALTRAVAKDGDMSELMKSIGDIQRSAQNREDDANALRKAAEEKANEVSRLLNEARGEVSILAHEKTTLKEALDVAKKDLEDAENCINSLKGEVLEQKGDLNSHLTQLRVEKELRARAEDKEQEERHERIALSAQMVAMTKEHAQKEGQLKEANESNERGWRDKFEGQKDTIIDMERKLSEAKEAITSLKAERSSLKEAINEKKTVADAQTVEENGRLRGEVNVLKDRLLAAEKQATSFGQASAEHVHALEAQIREGQAERRRMHNVIQELRGNVRVFARIRPFLPGDGVDDDTEPSVLPKSDSDLTILHRSEGRDQNFSFDRVFSPSVGQEAIFEEVSEFVQSALDGYNVCLFSYGQTGSGKTHTMQGSGVGQMRGIIPRAIEQVGKYKHSLEKDGWQYEMKVSFLEIYNETIRDLLRDEKADEAKHEIKVNRDGSRHVTDLTLKVLEPSDQTAVEAIMRQAAKHRSVASTDMNSVSSRSHSVFTLHLTAFHREHKRSLKGILNLCDLAGSERLQRSGATGDRAKEAMAINKSLSSLTDVFVAIGKKASHIPFRNSKLTYLLQPSLSGDGKTLMMANISPTDESFQESLCSLRFAAQVNKCELGKPKRAISDDTDGDGRRGGTPRPTSAASPRKKLPSGRR